MAVKRLDEFGGNVSFGQLNPLVNIVLIEKIYFKIVVSDFFLLSLGTL